MTDGVEQLIGKRYSCERTRMPAQLRKSGDHGVHAESVVRKSDFEWFLRAKEELKDFKGQYVAILDGKIVGHGKTAGDVLKRIKKLQGKPLISFVPGDEVLEA
jgi:hypothetical protein